MTRTSLLLAALASLGACTPPPTSTRPAAAAPTPATTSATPDAPAAVEATRSVRILATLPPGMPGVGRAFVAVYRPEEIAANLPRDPARLFEVLDRIRAVRDEEASDEVVGFELAVPASGAVVVHVFFDADNHGLEALFGPRAGLAQGFASVAADAREAAVALEGAPPAAPSEPCVGARQTLLVLDAPETRRLGDEGRRLACVQVPASYAAGDRRYPVVFALPGFSGSHARSDAWGARDLFDEAAVETGVEAIYVGVGTRTAEGTSYFASSARFGDWDAYFARRLVPEIDRRFRTDGRRAAVGHSTGGWNAVHLALNHPELVQVVGASAPDPLDFGVWLREGAHLRPRWRAWLRAEHEMGGRGQFVSWAAAWSPDARAPLGFRWPADVITGAVDEAVFALWQAQSPRARLETEAGRAAASRLSGSIAITAGRADEFDLFAPTEAFAQALSAAGVEVLWLPTALGHFGGDATRWHTMTRFVLRRLGAPADR
jgi:S-formylglutathione hydrolase FrmB